MGVDHHRLAMASRMSGGRATGPSAGIVDSQSAKTTESGGPRGFDAGKKVKGRKRHIVTDTGGLLVAAPVHPADIRDRDGATVATARTWLFIGSIQILLRRLTRQKKQ